MNYSCTVENQQNWRQQGIIYVRRKKYDLTTKEKVLYETEYLVFNMRKLRRIGVNLVRICFMVLILLVDILVIFEFLTSGNEKMFGNTQEKKITIEDSCNKEKKKIVGRGQTYYDTDELFIERCINESLTEDEMYQQAQDRGGVEILQYYINYLYAMHGQMFEEGGEVARTFEDKEWYREIKGEWREVSYEELNSNEQHNVDTMVGLLEREGYR